MVKMTSSFLSGGVKKLERYIFHFDINKTIMMSDPVSSMTIEAMLNSILSECVWGVVTPIHQEQMPSFTWEMHSSIPSHTPPEDITNLMSYGEYLENILKVPRPERKHSKAHFTEHGYAGESCREHFLYLLDLMEKLPSDQLIMPSFFRFVLELKNRELDFGLIFRTFGSDSLQIAEEFNRFCGGLHPCYKESSCTLDLSSLKVDTESSFGKFTRSRDEEMEHYQLELGSYNNKSLKLFGAENIYKGIVSHIFDNNMRSMIIQDDFSYWHSLGESDCSGKLLLIDNNCEKDVPTTVQIFFDDNIERDRAHIVDARRLPSLNSINFEEANNIYYARVSPMDVIQDSNYFIQMFDNMVARRHVMMQNDKQ